MTQSSDPQKCAVRWCDEVLNHVGRHIRYAGEIVITDSWQPVRSISVTLECAGETRPALVVTVASARPSRYQAARLDWEQADQLAGLLSTNGARWRP